MLESYFLRWPSLLDFAFFLNALITLKKQNKKPLYFGLVLDLEILINFNVEKDVLKI